jgi:isoleucyl-tRNA synthetase
VRRSRRRFWRSEADADKQAAYATLYEVLVTLTKLMAPIIPFTTETMYQNLVRSVDANAPESVHHCLWPAPNPAWSDDPLLADMATARIVVALGHATRAAHNLKVRQPLVRAVAVVPPGQRDGLMRMRDLVAEELNVKAVELAANEAELITYKLLPNNKLLGPKFGQRFPQVRAALESADPAAAVATLRGGQALSLVLSDGSLAPITLEEVIVNPLPRPGFAVASENEVVVALDTIITPELRLEGLAREIVRRIQDLRKSAGFDISDRIITHYQAAPGLAGAFASFAAYIKVETLSVDLLAGAGPNGAATLTDTVDGETLTLALVQAPSAGSQEEAPLTSHPGARDDSGVSPIPPVLTDDVGSTPTPEITGPAPVRPPAHAPRPAPRQAARKATKKAVKPDAKKVTTKKAASKVAAKEAAAKKAAKKTVKKTANRTVRRAAKKAAKKPAKKR